jgi:hypothetical protein
MNRNATALILIVLAIGIYFTVTKGFIADIKEIKVDNNRYTTAIANAEQLIKVREQVLKTYSSLTDADRDRLSKMVPSTVDNIRLVIDLDGIGRRHGFKLENIEASTPTKADPAKTTTNGPRLAKVPDGTLPTATLDSITVSFSVTAPYLEFLSFLQDIEANLRLMDISSLKVVAGEKGMYDFEVELKTYWLRQQ